MYSSSTERKLKQGIKIGGALTVAVLVVYFIGRSPTWSDEGYRPVQPVPFDHLVHVKQLNIHCVYCHTSVEKSAHSTVPPTATCMNCHVMVKRDSPKLKLVRESYEKGIAIPWVRIHALPEFVFFNHSRHIQSGIDCATCHGKVEDEAVIVQKKPLSMGWCIDCHRHPNEQAIRTRPISGVDVRPEVLAAKLKRAPDNCNTCHH